MRDLKDPFCPISVDSLTVPVNMRDQLNVVVETITDIIEKGTFGDSSPNKAVSGAACKAACDVLSTIGGRVLIFATRPVFGYGQSTVFEYKNNYTTRSDDFLKLAMDIKGSRTAVDLFCLSTNSFDYFSFSGLSKASGGQSFYYSLANNLEFTIK